MSRLIIIFLYLVVVLPLFLYFPAYSVFLSFVIYVHSYCLMARKKNGTASHFSVCTAQNSPLYISHLRHILAYCNTAIHSYTSIFQHLIKRCIATRGVNDFFKLFRCFSVDDGAICDPNGIFNAT